MTLCKAMHLELQSSDLRPSEFKYLVATLRNEGEVRSKFRKVWRLHISSSELILFFGKVSYNQILMLTRGPHGPTSQTHSHLEDGCLLRCSTVQSGGCIPTFQRRYNPEDGCFNTRRREDLRSDIAPVFHHHGPK